MLDAVIAGILLGLALVFSVGPVIFTIIKLRINYGISTAFYFIAGVWLSDILWVITANLFSGLLKDLLAHQQEIGTVGGLFLISLGVYYLFFKKYHTGDENVDIKISNLTHAKLFATGFLINTLNPGVIALWLGATTKTINNSFNEMMMTFGICLAINITADVFKIELAGKLKKKLTGKNITLINKISGTLFIAFGVLLIAGVIYKAMKHS